jgi:Heterokaryon incompatibility protein (HET)
MVCKIITASFRTTFEVLGLRNGTEETERTLEHTSVLEDKVTDSTSSLQMVAQWLRTCLTQHNDCHYPQDNHPVLLTQVIDVGSSDGSEDPKLFITQGQRGIYVSLSYCWGNVANLRTEIATVTNFQKRIPFNIIPKTIQEKIILTRRLGIRYLWADTLCIIQDSQEHWLREASNISSVYRNPVLTIAASAVDSLDCEGGLFRPRKRLGTRPIQFAPKTAPFKYSKLVFAFGDR